MKPVKCDNCKKFYDADKYESCPHCKSGAEANSFSTKKDSSSPSEKKETPASERSESFRHKFFSKLNKSDSELHVSSEQENNEKTSEEVIDIYSHSDYTAKKENDVEAEEKTEESSNQNRDDYYEMVSDIVKEKDTETVVMPIAEAVRQADAVQSSADEKTIAFYDFSNDIEPVVGWLVCVKGEYHGASFNLKSGRNNIGRALTMDVALAQEKSVSRERHASITFDPHQKKFFVQSGESRGLTYVNDELLISFKEMNAYDIISLGACKLMFLPLCGDKFDWENYM